MEKNPTRETPALRLFEAQFPVNRPVDGKEWLVGLTRLIETAERGQKDRG